MRENAANAARLLAAEGKRRIVLVMHGFDVRRAKREFENAGLEVIPAPTQVVRWDDLEAADFLPADTAVLTSHYAPYELVALARNGLLARPCRSGSGTGQ